MEQNTIFPPQPPSEEGVKAETSATNANRPPPMFSALQIGSTTMLKKRAENLKFVSYDLGTYGTSWKVSVNERQRLLDKLHLHTPTPQECKDLNIPSDRLDLLTMKNILYLSGGCVGGRFSSEEFLFVQQTLRGMSQSWLELDSIYRTLDAAAKKITLSSDSVPLDSDGRVAGLVDVSNMDVNLANVAKYHLAADTYVSHVKSLQSFVQRKQNAIDRNSTEDRDFSKIDADPEGKIGKSMPDWLSTLIEKYSSENNLNSNEKPTVGKLSVFLGACVLGRFSCTKEEASALSWLLQASNDSQTIFSNSEMEGTGEVKATDGLKQQGSALPKHTQKYWATRIFNFLSKMTELKTMIKDSKALENL